MGGAEGLERAAQSGFEPEQEREQALRLVPARVENQFTMPPGHPLIKNAIQGTALRPPT
jgi:hypothetical protein